MSSIRSEETKGLIIPSTLVLEGNPGQLDQDTLHRLCLGAKAVEAKHSADLEERREAQFNDYLAKIGAANEKEVRIVLIEIVETISKQGKKPEMVALESRQEELLQHKQQLGAQLEAATAALQELWPEAQEQAAATLCVSLAQQKTDIVTKIESAMGVAPGEIKDLGKNIEALNEEVVAMVQDRPSLPDMMAKQQAAYDAKYRDQIEKGQSPAQAISTIIQLAEDRHNLMGKIRAAGAARSMFTEAGNDKSVAAALAYANEVPFTASEQDLQANKTTELTPYQQALYAENKALVTQIIGLEYELKANAKDLCENTRNLHDLYAKNTNINSPVSQMPVSGEAHPPLEEAGFTKKLEEGMRLAARTITRFLDRNENRAEERLQQEGQSNTNARLTP